MFKLTKEQKISNLEEILQQLVTKKSNLELQISGIEEKLEKLRKTESSSKNSSIYDSANSAISSMYR